MSDASVLATLPISKADLGLWEKSLNDLRAMRQLTDDWDGQGAIAPDPALVDGAVTLAQQFLDSGKAPPDFVIAGANGTIFFEWHTPAGYLEIEVLSPDRAEGRFLKKGADTAEVFEVSPRS